MTTSEQLERDAEAARIRISATLDELRGRMTPGQVVDQIVDYMRNRSGATFARNFRRQVVNNPVPVTLVGAGLAWLAMASRRPSDGGVDLAHAGEMATDAGRGAVSDAASTAYDAAAQGSRQGAEMLGRAADTLRETAAASGRNIMDVFKDQPLILAGVGLALGALLGASLPVSEAEDRLMGEASDATKREANDFAKQQLDKGKAVGQEALNAVGRALDQQLDERRRAEEDVQARPDAPTAAEGEAGREAPLVPSHDSGVNSGVMGTESHGAAGERERE